MEPESNNNSGPYLSIIISAYKNRGFLKEAIISCINQNVDKKFYEIIIVKNFEDKDIDKLIKDNKIISIFSNDSSLSGKIISGLKISKGEIISFLDDDDKFTEDKIKTIIDNFSANKDLVYFHNSVKAINFNGEEIGYYNYNPDFNMSSISIKKNIIDIKKLGNVYKSIDTFMYMEALESGKKITISDNKLTYYRVITNSVTHNFTDMNSFIEFNIKSLKLILESYNTMYKLFNSKYVKKLLLHKIAFVKIRLKIYGNISAGIKSYIILIFTPSYEKKSYEIKTAIASIISKKRALKIFYKNEIEKNSEI